LRAYPGYSLRVFVRDEPGPELQRGMELLEYAGDFEVITGAFGWYFDVPRIGAYLRFLLFTEERAHYWDGFDYVYITDADMLIVRQEPALHEQHVAHMEAIGLPYSAMMRAGEPNVVTALLFASREFIERICESATDYDRRLSATGQAVLDTARRIPDERLLYQIIRDSDIPLPPQHDAKADPDGARLSDPSNYRERVFRPWHGLNLGANLRNDFIDTARPRFPFTQDAAWQIRRTLNSPLGRVCCQLLTPAHQGALRGILAATRGEGA
jgi:hypothetical protein